MQLINKSILITSSIFFSLFLFFAIVDSSSDPNEWFIHIISILVIAPMAFKDSKKLGRKHVVWTFFVIIGGSFVGVLYALSMLIDSFLENKLSAYKNREREEKFFKKFNYVKIINEITRFTKNLYQIYLKPNIKLIMPILFLSFIWGISNFILYLDDIKNYYVFSVFYATTHIFFSSISWIVIILLLSAIYLINFLFGGKANYFQILKGTTLSFIPFILNFLLFAIIFETFLDPFISASWISNLYLNIPGLIISIILLIKMFRNNSEIRGVKSLISSILILIWSFLIFSVITLGMLLSNSLT